MMARLERLKHDVRQAYEDYEFQAAYQPSRISSSST